MYALTFRFYWLNAFDKHYCLCLNFLKVHGQTMYVNKSNSVVPIIHAMFVGKLETTFEI